MATKVPTYVKIPAYATLLDEAAIPPPAFSESSASNPTTPPRTGSFSFPATLSPSSSFSAPRSNVSSILLSHALSALPAIPADGQIRKPEDEALASAKDPLSLPIMSANFRRFIGKCQVLFWLQDRVEEIVLWRKGARYTGAWMLGYTLLCFFPRLALLIPHVVLLHVLCMTYQTKYPQKSGTNDPTSWDNVAATEMSPAIQPGEGTPDWFANLQAIQNLMGVASDGYDMVVPHLVHLTWTTPTTQPLFLFTVVSFLLLLPVALVIPLRPLFLVLGLLPFVLTHPYTLSMMPSIIRRVQPHIYRLAQRLVDNSKLSEVHWYSQMDVVAVWENERWTAEKGFKAGNLRISTGERRPWTKDVDGWSSDEAVQGAPFDGTARDLNLPLPAGWKFVETENWIVDLFANWRDVLPDEEGWIYTDDNWKAPSTKPLEEWKVNGGGVTRSRKWVRRVYLATH